MRSTRHQSDLPRASRLLIAGGALLVALAIGGCSAVNMTGFSMPVFGLTKKSAEESDALATSSIYAEENESATSGQTQGLADRY